MYKSRIKKMAASFSMAVFLTITSQSSAAPTDLQVRSGAECRAAVESQDSRLRVFNHRIVNRFSGSTFIICPVMSFSIAQSTIATDQLNVDVWVRNEGNTNVNIECILRGEQDAVWPLSQQTPSNFSDFFTRETELVPGGFGITMTLRSFTNFSSPSIADYNLVCLMPSQTSIAKYRSRHI